MTTRPKEPLHDQHRVGVLARDSSRLFRQLLQEYVSRFELSYNQYLLLREVYDIPRITQRTASTNTGIATTAMVALADALIKRGYLTRERSTTDRREANLVLTRAGRGVASQIVRKAIEINRIAVFGMTANEAKTLGALLIRSNDNLRGAIAAAEQDAMNVKKRGPRDR